MSFVAPTMRGKAIAMNFEESTSRGKAIALNVHLAGFAVRLFRYLA